MTVPVEEVGLPDGGFQMPDPSQVVTYAQYLALVRRSIRAYTSCLSRSGVTDMYQLPYLVKFQNTIRALELKYLCSPMYTFMPGISLRASGFPSYHDIVQLSADKSECAKRLILLPTITEGKRQLIDTIFADYPKGTVPRYLVDRQKWALSERAYLEMHESDSLFYQFNEGDVQDITTDADNSYQEKGRRTYVFSWAVYDINNERPVIFKMTCNQDEAEPSMLDPGSLSLPRLRQVLQYHTGQSLESLAAFAGLVDQQSRTLHPKEIQRTVIGPLVAPTLALKGDTPYGLVVNNIIPLFEKARCSTDDYLLIAHRDTVFSQSEVPGGALNSMMTLLDGRKSMNQLFAKSAEADIHARGASHSECVVIMSHALAQCMDKSILRHITGRNSLTTYIYDHQGIDEQAYGGHK
jgi:hypothetical protein